MKKGFFSLILFILLLGSLSVTLGNVTPVSVNIKQSEEGFNVYLFFKDDLLLNIDFAKNADKIFAKDFSAQLLKQSIPGAPYDSMLKGDDKLAETVYVNEQKFAAVTIVEIETDKHILNGFIGDMVISYDQKQNAHSFWSTTLTTYNPERAFREFDQYSHLGYSIPKAEIRLLVILDTPLYEKLKMRYSSESSIKVYLSIMLNAVRMRLRITTKNTINLVISRVIALEDSNLFPESSEMWGTSFSGETRPCYKAEESLRAFAAWLLHESSNRTHNLATLLTNREFVDEKSNTIMHGLSYHKGAGILGTIDDVPMDMGAIILYHTGNLDSSAILVHEMMHALGCEHDKDDENALMAEGHNRESFRFSLSEQNATNLENFLKSDPGKHFKASTDRDMQVT